MATTSDVKVTPGTGANVATYDITEDSETKKLQRLTLNDSSGVENVGSVADTAYAGSGNSTVIAALKGIFATNATLIGGLTDAAPASDTASASANGRLQRIAQNITTFSSGVLAAITTFGSVKAERVVVHDGSGNVLDYTAASPVTQSGTWNVGLTGTLPAFATAPAVTQSGTWTVQPGNTANTTPWKVDGSSVNQPTFPLPATPVSGAITTAMTGTATTSLMAAPGAGLRNYVTCIIVSNSHATVGTDVIIQDGSGGTTLMTIPAAAVYGGAVITLPTPLKQPTLATALFCANVTTGASTKVSAVGYTAA